MLDEVSRDTTSDRLWRAYFQGRNFDKTILWIFDLVRKLLSMMLETQAAGTSGQNTVDKNYEDVPKKEKTVNSSMNKVKLRSLARKPYRGRSFPVKPRSGPFRFVKVNTSVDRETIPCADIAPSIHTMRLYPSFFSDCGDIKQLGPSVEATTDWPRAIILLHELVHYVSYHNFLPMMTRANDERMAGYAFSADIRIIEDMEMIISSELDEGSFTRFQPMWTRQDRTGKHKLVGPRCEQGKFFVNCYGHKGARILAKLLDGDVGSLLNADSYACFAELAYAERYRQSLVRRLSLSYMVAPNPESDKSMSSRKPILWMPNVGDLMDFCPPKVAGREVDQAALDSGTSTTTVSGSVVRRNPGFGSRLHDDTTGTKLTRTVFQRCLSTARSIMHWLKSFMSGAIMPQRVVGARDCSSPYNGSC